MNNIDFPLGRSGKHMEFEERYFFVTFRPSRKYVETVEKNQVIGRC